MVAFETCALFIYALLKLKEARGARIKKEEAGGKMVEEALVGYTREARLAMGELMSKEVTVSRVFPSHKGNLPPPSPYI